MTLNKHIPITAMSHLSSMGNSDFDLISALKENKCSMTKEHRFAEICQSYLGEVDVLSLKNQFHKLGDDASILNLMVFDALDKIIEKSDLLTRYKKDEIAIFFGTTTSGIESSLPHFFEFLKSDKTTSLIDFLSENDLHGSAMKVMRDKYPLKCFNMTITNSCASGAHAIMEGAMAIEMGLCKACIVGGFDVLCKSTIYGFNALQILDQDETRPFCLSRKGINLSDGGGFLLLEAPSTSADDPIAYLAGYAVTSDAFHITQPEPEGKGMELTMAKALDLAQISYLDISYINAHGTGTLLNDKAELKAISRLFKSSVPVSTTKGLHGHTLAGSGGLESVISILALQNNVAWKGKQPVYDDAFEMGSEVCHANNDYISSSAYVMSNSFGFGGSNACLIFKGV